METKGSAEFFNSSSIGTPDTQSAIRTIGSNEETPDDSKSWFYTVKNASIFIWEQTFL